MDKPKFQAGIITGLSDTSIGINGKWYKLGNKAKDTASKFKVNDPVSYFTNEEGTFVMWLGVPKTQVSYGEKTTELTNSPPSPAQRRDNDMDKGNAIMWQSMMKNATELIKAKYAMREEMVTTSQLVYEIVDLTDQLYEASIRKMLGIKPIMKAEPQPSE